MDINAIGQLFGQYCFPIGISIFLIYFMQTEMKEMRKTIENNTLTMQKLVDKLNEDKINDEG